MKILFLVLFLHAMAFVPGTASSVTTEIELSISARKLRKLDLLSKSDPMCVVYIQSFDTKEWKEYFRTETINNNHDPDFLTKVHMEYEFEEQQPLKFELYDIDSNSSVLRKHDFLGFAVCNLGQIISNRRVQLQLQRETSSGKIESIESYIVLSAEELTPTDDEVILQMNGRHLDRKKWFLRKSDPFIEIYKNTINEEYVLVHKTEVINRTTNPRWQRFVIHIKKLCNDDYHRRLKFVCWSRNGSGSHSLIGVFYTTLGELSEKKAKFNLIHEEQKKKKRRYKHSGEINVEYFEIYKIYSFMDYVMGGLQIHCTIAIDFTSSNGDPRFPTSLHYISDVALNCYEEAIIAIVPIIEDYDTDKKFPALGFGARLHVNGHTVHEFPVNMSTESPYCDGTAGVLQEYRTCIRKIQLAGPTHFAPVIEHVINHGQEYNNGKNYFILLILTDGTIGDMDATVQAVVKASALPISLIIIGIGDADFTKMRELDNDDNDPLESGNGHTAKRDIVQFVPFNSCRAQGDPRTVERRLAKEVLAEIPKQVSEFMNSNHFVPGPPKLDPSYLPPNPNHL